MVKSSTTIPAGKFKAQCLALLDDVAATRRSVIVTKHGKPVAMVVPVDPPPPVKSLAGSILHEDDIVAPLGENWNANA